MREARQHYQELISLTQLFLFREYSLPKKMTFPIIKNEGETLIPPTPNAAPKPILPAKKPVSPSLNPSLEPLFPSPLPSNPVIIQEKKEPLKEKEKKWELEPLKAPLSPLGEQEFWTLLPTLFPHTRLFKSIPSDSEARKIKEHWLKEQDAAILILSFGEEEKSVNFLKKMAQGISERLAPARVLSFSRLKKEEEWQPILTSPSLRLIIASDYALYMHPQLMRHYREHPQQRKYFLFDKSLLLLSDPSLYLKEPQLKALLWKTICNEFASVSPSP